MTEEFEFCMCEFEPDDYLYRRVCTACGGFWFGLHCRHDGAQNPCPECGTRPTTVNEDVDPGADVGGMQSNGQRRPR